MTLLLTAPTERPRNVAVVLRGDRARRPLRDVTTAPGLRARLEDAVFDLLGSVRPATALVVRASDVAHDALATPLTASVLGRLRGLLVAAALRLVVVGVHLDAPFDDAVAAWRFDAGRSELVEAFDALDADQLARLRSDVEAHVTTLRTELGSLPAHWQPRTGVRACVTLAGGSMELRDTLDLVVGSPQSARANVALVDCTTSPLGPSAERALRFHALVQTLRTSVVPLRSSVFSTATGELWTRDVDADLLGRAVDDVVTVLTNRGGAL